MNKPRFQTEFVLKRGFFNERGTARANLHIICINAAFNFVFISKSDFGGFGKSSTSIFATY